MLLGAFLVSVRLLLEQDALPHYREYDLNTAKEDAEQF